MSSMSRMSLLLCVTVPGVLGLGATASAQDAKADQAIATLMAEADYLRAQLARVNAEISLAQYIHRTYPQELEALKSEFALAEAERKRAEDRLEWARRMFEKGPIPKSQQLFDKFRHDQKVFAVEQARTKLKVFAQYTKDKTIKELQSEVEKARSDESAKRSAYEEARVSRAK